MKEKTACFTGHRRIRPEHLPALAQRLRETIVYLIAHDYRYFGTGGALGFDTLAAKTILDLKAFYPQIRLILVLPCRTQTRGWPETDILTYNDILQRADKVVYTSQAYTRGCMLLRNRHLVDHSSVCICYLISNQGGTAYTVRYAMDRGVRVIRLFPAEASR